MTNSSETPVDLWFSRCGAATASAIAIRKGWLHAEFAGSNVRLNSLKESAESAVRDAHYHHGLSGLFREGGNVPPIWARAGGADTAVIGITWIDEYQGILVRADSDIRSLADLAGKRLALPEHHNLIDFQRAAALHGFVTALGLAGLDRSAVEFIDLDARRTDGSDRQVSVEVEALLAGRVDAIFLRFARGAKTAADPRFRQLINLNDLEDPLLRVNNGTPRPVTVDRAFLDRHPTLVVRYLAVLLRTSAWAAAHSRDVIELLSQDAGQGADVEDVLASHGSDVHRSFAPKLSALYIQGLEREKNFLRDHGFLKADFDIADWIVHEPLARAQELVALDPLPRELQKDLAA